MRPHHRTTAIVFALVAVVFGVFFRTLESGFLRWDDDINVFENEKVQGLTAANLRWMFTDFEQAIRYKPLSWLAWATVHEVFGLNPFGYHLANVLLHCVNTVLVFLLIRRLLAFSGDPTKRNSGTSELCAALGTLLWAVHPLRVEPVAWVTGLPYHLALCFALAATLCYLRAQSADLEAATRRGSYWLSVGLFALAVTSYPIVLGYVAALVALDFFPLRRFQGGGTFSLVDAAARRVWLEKVPFLLLSVVLVAGTVYGRYFVTGDWHKPAQLAEFGVVARLMQAFYLWAYYVWKSLLPLDLGPFYTTLLGNRPFDPAFTFSALGVLGVTGFLLCRWQRWPAALALWLAHLGLLVPMLGLTERPHYPHDRYSIVNGVVLAVAATLLLWCGCARVGQRRALIIAGVLAALCVGSSVRQVRIWENDFVFFKDLLQRMPPGGHLRAVALLKLGNAHAEAGEDGPAEVAYREALRVHPATTVVQLPYNLGNVLVRAGRWAEAEAAYAQALALDPRHLAARNNYGIALARQGKFDAAFAQFDEALRLKPDSADTHLNYGIALADKGDLNRAVENLTRALQLNPQSADIHAQLAEVFTKQGKPDLARQHAAEAERLKKLAEPR
jgi:tetratricopeptide (TPR) repeat protein